MTVKLMQLKTISYITMSTLLMTTLLMQTCYGYQNPNSDNPKTHIAFAQQQAPLSETPFYLGNSSKADADLIKRYLNGSYNPENTTNANTNASTEPSQKVVDDTTKLQYKITLDKCTPFNKHINDTITLPKIPYSYEKVHTQTISCKDQLSTLASMTCDFMREGSSQSIIFPHPNNNNVRTSVCMEPRFVNWYNHYWKTINSIILQILSNTDWSGSLGDPTGSTTIAGQGNKNIPILSCKGDDSTFYFIVVGKRDSDASKHITLNVIANASSILGKDTLYPNADRQMASPQIENTHTTNAPFGSVSASGQC